MSQAKDTIIKLSVRNLVEFILRSGDLSTSKNRRDPDAMLAGGRLHRKIQKRMGPEYKAEVPLSLTIPVTEEDLEFEITLEGRADGIITKEGNVTIDEIKCIYAPLAQITEMIPIHRGQALCYAYMYAKNNQLSEITIQLTYCHIESETIKQFTEYHTFDELTLWFQKLISEYIKWASWQIHWKRTRDKSILSMDFPFEYRGGQKELVTGVYKTILRNKKLFIEAPTGVGKTISTIFPAVKAMGMGLTSRIFYLTAKTITQTVARHTFEVMEAAGLAMKIVSITAKEKVCILDHPNCDSNMCERAKGHFDRVNDAVYDLLTNQTQITRELILSYAKKHCVCPFEMCLDLTSWADAIICDYNYVFDPNVSLKRFFAEEKKQDYVFLVDEAHNLVDRAREMYSAVLIKEQFLELKKTMDPISGKLANRLLSCHQILLSYQRESNGCEIRKDCAELVLPLMRLMTEFEEFAKEVPDYEGKDEVNELYFRVRDFLTIYDTIDDDYVIYTDFNEQKEFFLKLLCMNPARNLLTYLNKGRSAVFFSATLLPIRYYKEQLGGSEEDYAVYAPSPFDTKNRLLLTVRDVSTKYTRRTLSEYQKMAAYIQLFVEAQVGNYLVFFPSYQVMQQVYEQMKDRDDILLQTAHMTEREKEEYLAQFTEMPQTTMVGFCVMGGIFSEGIDLTKDRLIGTVIVGTGLPQVSNERELYKNYYDKKNHSGFDHAYLYQGMNKVLQSAGRVIRTVSDHGAILLLDERFLNAQYQNLFPREWDHFEVVTMDTIQPVLRTFWDSIE